ncbi:hypothetical protein CEXT_607591 [Caerostris extrusa]|uniref:Uncharacterized protein n=1 Tax=Caerostris extrusa TaxID=172846 RepID=A0AAV4Y5E1_CAEEX|nr:hypothetical protein CEXT_607591 [Caerostris extrusa]
MPPLNASKMGRILVNICLQSCSSRQISLGVRYVKSTCFMLFYQKGGIEQTPFRARLYKSTKEYIQFDLNWFCYE